MARKRKPRPIDIEPLGEVYTVEYDGNGNSSEAECALFGADASQGYYRLTIQREHNSKIVIYISPDKAARMMFQANGVIKQATEQQMNNIEDAS